jgi:shikimate dehydrogenase
MRATWRLFPAVLLLAACASTNSPIPVGWLQMPQAHRIPSLTLDAKGGVTHPAPVILLRAGRFGIETQDDGIGLVMDLVRNLGVTVAGARLLLLGAGGAVRGVLAPLLEQEPREICIANRTPERAIGLRDEFSDLGEMSASSFDAVDDRPWDIVVNATAASLAGEVPALPPRAVGAETVCYDMAYGRSDTAFMRWAQERGALSTYKGWGMLVEQAAESYLLWHGVRPATRPVIDALERL